MNFSDLMDYIRDDCYYKYREAFDVYLEEHYSGKLIDLIMDIYNSGIRDGKKDLYLEKFLRSLIDEYLMDEHWNFHFEYNRIKPYYRWDKEKKIFRVYFMYDFEIGNGNFILECEYHPEEKMFAFYEVIFEIEHNQKYKIPLYENDIPEDHVDKIVDLTNQHFSLFKIKNPDLSF